MNNATSKKTGADNVGKRRVNDWVLIGINIKIKEFLIHLFA